MAENRKPYVFISYAHADSATVLPVVDAMKKAGIELWFDEGIQAGSEWPEYIAEQVMGCEKFVLFISPAYLESQNCKRELNFAISRKKAILSVYMEDVELSPGVEMQLGTYQALFRNRYADEAAFRQALSEEAFFDGCRLAAQPAVAPVTPAPVAPAPVAPVAKKSKLPLLIGGAVALVAAVAVALVLLLGQGGGAPYIPALDRYADMTETAYRTGEFDGLAELAPPAFWDTMEEAIGMDATALIQSMEEQVDTESALATMKEALGNNVTVTYTVSDEKRMVDENGILSPTIPSSLYILYGIPNEAVTDAYEMRVTFTAKGSLDQEVETKNCVAVKVDGTWYIAFADGGNITFLGY